MQDKEIDFIKLIYNGLFVSAYIVIVNMPNFTYRVASHADAWIGMLIHPVSALMPLESHPTRAREFKGHIWCKVLSQ